MQSVVCIFISTTVYAENFFGDKMFQVQSVGRVSPVPIINCNRWRNVGATFRRPQSVFAEQYKMRRRPLTIIYSIFYVI